MKKKKVLLIEDDVLLCQIYRTNLELEGFAVEEAHNGKSGLAFALTHKPDLIILDLMLPQINGLEILKVIKENPTTAQIPVMVLTNLGDEEVEEAKKLGASECFLKTTVTPEKICAEAKKSLSSSLRVWPKRFRT